MRTQITIIFLTLFLQCNNALATFTSPPANSLPLRNISSTNQFNLPPPATAILQSDTSGVDLSSNAPPTPTCQLVAFAQAGFTGSPACISQGTLSNTQLNTTFPTKSINSVQLAPGYVLTVKLTNGTTRTIAQTSDNLGLNGSIVAADLRKCLAVSYKGANLTGDSSCIDNEGAYLLYTMSGSVIIGSMLVMPGNAIAGYDYTDTTIDVRVASVFNFIQEFPRAVKVSIFKPTSFPALSDYLSARGFARAPWNRYLPPLGTLEILSSFQRTLFIGDSLSAQKRVLPAIPNPSYGYWGAPNTRFTNGYNWVDYFLADVSPPDPNVLAVGGSTIATDLVLRDSAYTQVLKAYSYPNESDVNFPNTLVFLWSGANDFLNQISSGIGSVDPIAFGIQRSNDMKAVIVKLIQFGVKNFVVANVPNFQDIPKGGTMGAANSQWAATAEATFSNDLFSWLSEYPAAFTKVDTSTFVHNWRSGTYSNAAMTVLTNSCVTAGGLAPPGLFPGNYVDMPCNSKMFHDPVHPTSLAHCGLAGLFESSMKNNGWLNIQASDPQARLTSCAYSRNQTPSRPPLPMPPPPGHCP